jgi:hypothetical protein
LISHGLHVDMQNFAWDTEWEIRLALCAQGYNDSCHYAWPQQCGLGSHLKRRTQAKGSTCVSGGLPMATTYSYA